jgi:hypothetical protein
MIVVWKKSERLLVFYSCHTVWKVACRRDRLLHICLILSDYYPRDETGNLAVPPRCVKLCWLLGFVIHSLSTASKHTVQERRAGTGSSCKLLREALAFQVLANFERGVYKKGVRYGACVRRMYGGLQAGWS